MKNLNPNTMILSTDKPNVLGQYYVHGDSEIFIFVNELRFVKRIPIPEGTTNMHEFIKSIGDDEK